MPDTAAPTVVERFTITLTVEIPIADGGLDADEHSFIEEGIADRFAKESHVLADFSSAVQDKLRAIGLIYDPHLRAWVVAPR